MFIIFFTCQYNKNKMKINRHTTV